MNPEEFKNPPASPHKLPHEMAKDILAMPVIGDGILNDFDDYLRSQSQVLEDAKHAAKRLPNLHEMDIIEATENPRGVPRNKKYYELMETRLNEANILVMLREALTQVGEGKMNEGIKSVLAEGAQKLAEHIDSIKNEAERDGINAARETRPELGSKLDKSVDDFLDMYADMKNDFNPHQEWRQPGERGWEEFRKRCEASCQTKTKLAAELEAAHEKLSLLNQKLGIGSAREI